MNSLTKDLKFIYKNMDSVSRYIIRYGTVLIATLAVSAIFFFVRSKLNIDPYFDITMYTALLFSMKECMGAVYILPMLAEILLTASGRK